MSNKSNEWENVPKKVNWRTRRPSVTKNSYSLGFDRKTADVILLGLSLVEHIYSSRYSIGVLDSKRKREIEMIMRSRSMENREDAELWVTFHKEATRLLTAGDPELERINTKIASGKTLYWLVLYTMKRLQKSEVYG
jgi:hypothetical protein